MFVFPIKWLPYILILGGILLAVEGQFAALILTVIGAAWLYFKHKNNKAENSPDNSGTASYTAAGTQYTAPATEKPHASAASSAPHTATEKPYTAATAANDPYDASTSIRFDNDPVSSAAPRADAGATESVTGNRFCGYCGAKVKPGSTFCVECGEKL